jgi:hypothetical protein
MGVEGAAMSVRLLGIFLRRLLHDPRSAKSVEENRQFQQSSPEINPESKRPFSCQVIEKTAQCFSVIVLVY